MKAPQVLELLTGTRRNAEEMKEGEKEREDHVWALPCVVQNERVHSLASRIVMGW